MTILPKFKSSLCQAGSFTFKYRAFPQIQASATKQEEKTSQIKAKQYSASQPMNRRCRNETKRWIRIHVYSTNAEAHKNTLLLLYLCLFYRHFKSDYTRPPDFRSNSSLPAIALAIMIVFVRSFFYYYYFLFCEIFFFFHLYSRSRFAFVHSLIPHCSLLACLLCSLAS